MNHKAAVAWSFGSKRKSGPFDSKIETPGPANYSEESYKNIKPHSASYSFGRDSKNKSIKPFTPGPGYYKNSLENLFGKQTPKYSIGKSKKLESLNITISAKNSGGLVNSNMLDIPGPGKYEVNNENLNKLKKKSPSYVFTTSPKFMNSNKSIPGPGEYNIQSKVGKVNYPKWSLNKSMREELFSDRKDSKNIPGPGSYTLTPKIGQGPKVSKNFKIIKFNY